MSGDAVCRVCGAMLSRHRSPDEPESLCAPHSAREGTWRVLDSKALVLAVEKLRRRYSWSVEADEGRPG